MKKIFKSLLRAIGIMCYFMVLNFAYTRMNLDRLVEDIKVFAGTFLVLGILALEKAYQKDSGEVAVTGMELLVLSIHSLSILHVITMFQYNFQYYLLTSSYVIAIYYVMKAIVFYTKERREYLKGLSDIAEIVKEEPVKKEAKKRKTKEKEETIEIETKKAKEKNENNKQEKAKTNNLKATKTKTKKQEKVVNKKKNTKKKEVSKKAKAEPKKELEEKTEAKETKKTKTKTKKKTEDNPKTKEKITKKKVTTKSKTAAKKKEIKPKKEGKEND